MEPFIVILPALVHLGELGGTSKIYSYDQNFRFNFLPMCGRSPEGLSGCLALAFGRNRDWGTAPDGSYGNLGKQTGMSACESTQFLFIFVLRV